ncbi:hypothetical protein LSH36_101g00020 [Paralvinella palmiformis]|uniref:ELMO domain-containing protein n=1 Tax=Paralvinella palmiformis TaxID=53620 RepID=A0AAD9K1K0_9ANNE|nr:hypothetical protein LSH36_101g00020 [Paralvinella palmiformis]
MEYKLLGVGIPSRYSGVPTHGKKYTGTGNSVVVEQEVTPVTLTDHLAKTQNPETQKWALALINALFLKADNKKRKKIAESIQSKSIRTIILNNVIRRTTISAAVEGRYPTAPQVDAEMSHQLYVLQTLLFNLLEERKNTKADSTDQMTLNCIKELRRLAFDVDGHGDSLGKRQNYVKDYKKLGFRNHANPVDDFTLVPPGVLALDNMVYFAKHHQEEYTKVVLENTTRADDHDLPVAEASIEMTKVLCDVLKVGEPPTEDGRVYYPMLFTHEKPFEELFCICLQLLNKTWKEMRAAAADFSKVLLVAQEQITRTMDKCSDNFDRFKNHLWSLSYQELNKIWLRDRKSKEELESQAKPIVELRERLKPEILDLIKQQRLNYLVEGSRFYSRPGRKGERVWFCCLSPNHKVFYYGECDEINKPTIEQLKNKLAVVDIKRLLTGKECPHVKEKRKHNTASLAFSIQTEAEIEKDPLNFIALDQEAFNMWTDGINALIGNPMTSQLAQQELEMLLSMEIKIRLLDTEGIPIPKTPPPIPEEPPNYDFSCNGV